jgi:cytochrome b involved in lipid metabolism
MDALPTDLLPATRKTALPHETLLLPDAVGDPPADLPEFDWEEIMQHNTPRDLWRVVGGHVYNVGELLFHHPGGAEVLLAQHGHDATAAFLKIGHPDYALALTRSFLIGKLRPGSQPPAYVAPLPFGGCPFTPAFAAPPDQAQPAAPSPEHTQAVPPSADMQPTAPPVDTRPAPSSTPPPHRDCAKSPSPSGN